MSHDSASPASPVAEPAEHARLSPDHAPYLPRQDRAPRHWFRMTTRYRPRAPSIGSMPDIAAEPDNLTRTCSACAWSPNTLFARGEPAPQSRRSSRPVLSEAAFVTLASAAGNLRKDASHRLLQPTCSTSTREPLDSPASNALRRPRRGWKARLTPSLQLRPSFATVSFRRRAPYRNGAARRRRFRPARSSKLDL